MAQGVWKMKTSHEIAEKIANKIVSGMGKTNSRSQEDWEWLYETIQNAIDEACQDAVDEWREKNKKGWASFYLDRIGKETKEARKLAFEKAAEIAEQLGDRLDSLNCFRVADEIRAEAEK